MGGRLSPTTSTSSSSGLARQACTAVTLERLGLSYTVIERHSDVGGVWLENDYPGAGVDTPSHLYAFSFAPNREWSRYYAKQPEIMSYSLAAAPEQFGLRDNIRFNTEVDAAHFDEATSMWDVTITPANKPGGRSPAPVTRLRANVVISCVGQLNKPSSLLQYRGSLHSRSGVSLIALGPRRRHHRQAHSR